MKPSTITVLVVALLAAIGAPTFIWQFPPTSPGTSSSWSSSIVSLLAFYVALSAFVWGRYDKDRDRAAGERQAMIAKAAVDAAQQQAENYLRLERPYLYIFNIKGPVHITDVEDPYYTLEYSVANYGKTPARVHEVLISRGFGIVPTKPTINGWYYWYSPLLLSGERNDKLDISLPESISVDLDGDENGQWLSFQEPDGEHFFVRIIAKYSGPFSANHETSACWRWDKDRFRLHGGDDMNYQR